MASSLEKRLPVWSASDTDVGCRNLERLMPNFERILLDTYVRGAGFNWVSLPPEVDANERIKLKQIATGKFDIEYLEGQKKIIATVAAQIDFLIILLLMDIMQQI